MRIQIWVRLSCFQGDFNLGEKTRKIHLSTGRQFLLSAKYIIIKNTSRAKCWWWISYSIYIAIESYYGGLWKSRMDREEWIWADCKKWEEFLLQKRIRMQMSKQRNKYVQRHVDRKAPHLPTLEQQWSFQSA